VTPERIKEIIDVFDFEPADDDTDSISELNRDERTGPDPGVFNP
jgi:2,5-diketo-D-gluconate reductase A